jgi:hypothetical protein
MKKTKNSLTHNQLVIIAVFVAVAIFTLFTVAVQVQLASSEQDIRNEALFLDR